MALKTWVDENQIPTLSLRKRFDDFVADASTSAIGNLLITSLPHEVKRDAQELEELTRWIDEGNFVLVMVSHDDQPDWVFASQRFFYELEEVGMDIAEYEPDSEYIDESAVTTENDDKKENKLDIAQTIHDMRELTKEREAITFTAKVPHPLLQNVKRVESTHHDRWPRENTILEGIEESRFALPLLQEENEKENVFWEVRQGAGGAWISSYPDLFGNVTLGKADNARLFANIVNASLGPSGTVIFEDFRFGLSELYNPDAFFSDRRLHNTLFFLGALWIIYALGRTNRLAPVLERERKTQAADFVGAMAGLHARRTDRRSIKQGLLKQFFNHVRQRYNLPRNGEPVWDLLQQNASIAKDDLARLRELAEQTGRFNQRELQKLSSRIQQMQSKLS